MCVWRAYIVWLALANVVPSELINIAVNESGDQWARRKKKAEYNE